MYALLRSLRRRASAVVLLPAFLGACTADEIAAPAEEPAAGAVTIDASAGWAFFDFDRGTTVAVAQPTASSDWDIAFNATSVMLNGGAAGPGGVTGYCICQNAGASTAEILAMTPQAEASDFAAVTAGSIPAAGAFVADRLVPAIAGWSSAGGAAATAVDRTFLLRRRTDAGFAKVRVTGIQNPTAATPGRVTLEYALQPAATAPLAATRTVTVDVPATGGVNIDLDAGAVAAAGAPWDLRFEGYTMRVNGGVSGTGGAGAANTTGAFAAITTASIEARAYATDRFSGIFSAHPWHKYNLQGDHRISPTFDVFLIRRGSDVYKVQMTDYYGPAGEVRRISVRYEQLAN